ncbi:hypothetical protein D3C85_1874940 [compost metagenome]
MYSFETVIEGLLGVPPISKKMEETIKSLATATNSHDFNLERVESIVQKITPHIDSLDTESKMYYHLAVNKILQSKTEGN